MAINHVDTLTASKATPPFSAVAAGLDAYGRPGNFLFAPRVVAKTASYTVKAEESGSMFFTTGAVAGVVFTLPVIGDGPWVFWFFNTVDQDMTVTAAAADTLIGYNDLDLDSIAASTTSEKIGAGIMAVCDGVKLVAVTLPGDPRYQTYTLAD